MRPSALESDLPHRLIRQVDGVRCSGYRILIRILVLVTRIGIGKGFPFAQRCVVVNALIGIMLFRDPPPRSLSARLTLIGVIIATLGAVILGNLKADF